MKRLKLSGLHLWKIDDHYFVLTRTKSIVLAVTKGKKVGAKCEEIKYLGFIDA